MLSLIARYPGHLFVICGPIVSLYNYIPGRASEEFAFSLKLAFNYPKMLGRIEPGEKIAIVGVR